jgi:hypothetical protein
MTEDVKQAYSEPMQESGRALISRQIKGPVVMLNLMRSRETADYSGCPQLAPEKPISGAAAYQLYIEHTIPFLRRSGGELIFLGRGGVFLIGPSEERWDAAMLVRQRSVSDFMALRLGSGIYGRPRPSQRRSGGFPAASAGRGSGCLMFPVSQAAERLPGR